MAPLAQLLECHTWRALAQSPYATRESSSMSNIETSWANDGWYAGLHRPPMEIAHHKLPQQPPCRLQAAVDARTKASLTSASSSALPTGGLGMLRLVNFARTRLLRAASRASMAGLVGCFDSPLRRHRIGARGPASGGKDRTLCDPTPQEHTELGATTDSTRDDLGGEATDTSVPTQVENSHLDAGIPAASALP
jgi:hypothetical protein